MVVCVVVVVGATGCTGWMLLDSVVVLVVLLVGGASWLAQDVRPASPAMVMAVRIGLIMLLGYWPFVVVVVVVFDSCTLIAGGGAWTGAAGTTSVVFRTITLEATRSLPSWV